MAAKKRKPTPGKMSHFQGGTQVERLKALIDDLAREEGVSRAEAARRYFERIAVDSGRATKAKGAHRVAPYTHGPAPDNWPPPVE